MTAPNRQTAPAAFGQEKKPGEFERYMDSYTVQDALRDGATKPIHFLPRLTDWHLWGDKLDKAFDQAFAHLDEKERSKLATQEAKVDANQHGGHRTTEIKRLVMRPTQRLRLGS
ncbi:MAG: hypothetical protein OEM99_18140 [Gammaproteobacteria bacterium]|nr:hypothetical protein [Gammaproteobacteria bacterium]